ncbi:MAG TPA: maleylpyruvate isomerase N-terminal domain-containing protein [Micromonospora sp.]
METTGLRQAYDVFLDELARGGFGSPPDGEWTAEQVVAHLVINDELMAQATEAVAAGSPHAFYNHDAIHGPQLDALVADAGDLAGLAERLRRSSAALCHRVEQITPTAADTPVSTHIRDGDQIRVDQSLPWARVIDSQQRLHLPAHTEQLRALRPAD